MRLINRQTMRKLFEVTDEIPLSREAIRVPLEMRGDGGVRKLVDGVFEITLPDAEDLTSFLSTLESRLRALGLPGEPG